LHGIGLVVAARLSAVKSEKSEVRVFLR